MMCYEILEISRRSEISYSILITSYEKITHTEHTIIPILTQFHYAIKIPSVTTFSAIYK
jgi:hypothetical protein